MAPRVLGRAFRPPGFYFEPGKSVHYRGNKELIFVSIAGPDRRDITVDELRQRVAGSITQIFATCVEYKDLYVAVRGEELYWQTVTQNFNSDAGFSDLPWALLKELVEKYVKARKAYHSRPDAPVTDLTEVVDRFIALHHETSNLPPSAGLLQLAVRTDPSDANAMSDSLPTAALPGSTADTTDLTPSEADLASVSTEPWPPGHFPSEDQVFLTHQYVRSLHSITPESRNAQDRKPGIPTGHSSPFQLRLILAYMALVNKGPEDTWCLYLLPIAFDDNRERQIWFRHSNRMSKQFQTTKAFLEYSQAMFASGREMTIAMLTPWFIDRPGLDAIGGAEQWLKHPLAMRTGMTLVIRAANVAGGARLQIVIYDPNLHDAPTRNALVAHGEPLVEYYRKLLGMIIDWVRETAAFPPVLEGWYGGRIQGVKLEEVGLDAVGLAALWIDKVVSGGALPPMAEDTMTADEERLLWEEKGFVPIERLLD